MCSSSSSSCIESPFPLLLQVLICMYLEPQEKINIQKEKHSLNPTTSLMVTRVPGNGAKFDMLKLP
ncbi:hypothetical protein YC2023_041275 [Brassica napus]